MAFTLLFNSFAFDVAAVGDTYGLGGVSAGVFADAEPIPLIGVFGFIPAGFVRGCFYVLRIVLLVLASLLVSFTTTSNDLTAALNDFLRPLKIFKVPTTDIAMMFSIALRFIPITADELMRIRAAQWARGAGFETGSLWQKLKAWQTVLIPLFIGLFRRADNLAVAMESRCYGLTNNPTRLLEKPFDATAWGLLVVGLLACVLLAIFA